LNGLGPAQGTIALHEPEFSGQEWAYVKDCIDTGWVSSVGAYVDRFERDLCVITGAKHAVATSNGTAALHICLLLAGVEAGDEVLMPALTFIATANAVSYTHAVPHFVDSEEATLGQAASTAGLAQSEFLRELGRRNISIHYGSDELAEDLRTVDALSAQ
jgi:perosamine synthetase